MNPYCDCGACCDACGHDADCTSVDITDDITPSTADCNAPDYDHDAYTL